MMKGLASTPSTQLRIPSARFSKQRMPMKENALIASFFKATQSNHQSRNSNTQRTFSIPHNGLPGTGHLSTDTGHSRPMKILTTLITVQAKEVGPFKAKPNTLYYFSIWSFPKSSTYKPIY